jgi:hypothetical protein
MAHVTTEECKEHRAKAEKRRSEKRSTNRWWIVGIVVPLALLLSGSTLSGINANHNLDTHSARQNGSLETIDVRLTNIETSIDRNHQMVEEILRKMPPEK